MEEQLSLAATGFERNSKTTRPTKFLLKMDRIVPWKRERNIARPFFYGSSGFPVGRREIESAEVKEDRALETVGSLLASTHTTS